MSLAAKTGDAFELGAWQEDELELADELRDKYDGGEWTKRT